MRLRRSSSLFVLCLLSGALAVGSARADTAGSPPPAAVQAATASQGVAVIGGDGARADAFALARAVYGSSLRPRGLDEVRARVLAGEPAPAGASKEVRDLAELRASVGRQGASGDEGDDAASRRLLGGIARDLHVKALLVVRRLPVARAEAAPVSGDGDGGAAPPAEGTNDADAGVPAPEPAGESRASARLFLADTEEFDAARYEPDAAMGWRGTVASLSSRFGPPPGVAAPRTQAVAPPTLSSNQKESKPFYSSAWFWGAVGAALVAGAIFWFASQDTDPGPIHLQMKVPR